VPSPHDVTTILRVNLGGAVIGFPAGAVQEIVRAVAITPLPGAPAIVEGTVNLRGSLIPVIDVRRRLALAPRPLDPDQFLVVLALEARLVAVRVDDVDDLVEVAWGAVSGSAELSPALSGLAGLAARDDGALVIYDPAAFVSQGEGEAIRAALAASA
jgi:purine-binding chemotaxis protein CheW